MVAPSCPPVAVIAGPTASGKSGAAQTIARQRNSVIINADASQLYRELRILTARPSLAEEQVTPHRLYGVLEAIAPASAAAWAEMARVEMAAAWASGHLPILVGGTGLYLTALIAGIAPVPAIDADIRAAVRALDMSAARAALEREDPAAAARLQPRDRQRTLRALEVVRSTGRPLAEWQQQREGGIAGKARACCLVIEVPPTVLEQRIAARFDAMLASGGVEEARALAALKLDPGLPVMKAIGLRPLLRHLAGDLSFEAARAAAIIETRQYAKRQRTWFRHQCPGWRRVSPEEAAGAMEHLLTRN